MLTITIANMSSLFPNGKVALQFGGLLWSEEIRTARKWPRTFQNRDMDMFTQFFDTRDMEVDMDTDLLQNGDMATDYSSNRNTDVDINTA